MKQILLRAYKDPFAVASPAAIYRRNLIGDNVGNLLFSNASYKLLATRAQQVQVGTLSGGAKQAAHLNATVDHVVLPLANAFRLTFAEQLQQLTETIEHLRVPVTVLGVGAQLNLDGKAGRLEPLRSEVQRFVRAVLERGPAIGVRGEFTAAYLKSLGFGAEHVTQIGCPSLFMRGSQLHIAKGGPITSDAAISMNLSPYVPGLGALVEHHRVAYPNLRYTAQHRDALGMLLYANHPPAPSKIDQRLLPTHRDHPLVAQGRTSFFVEPAPWLRYLADFEFSFGTRIHGNIAALLAGTPAHVLAHDSRTLELARHHAIPHLVLGKNTAVPDAAELHAATDYTAFNAQQPAHFAAFATFLRAHGLTNVFEAGEDAGAFERRMAATRYPGDVAAVRASYELRGNRIVRRLLGR